MPRGLSTTILSLPRPGGAGRRCRFHRRAAVRSSRTSTGSARKWSRRSMEQTKTAQPRRGIAAVFALLFGLLKFGKAGGTIITMLVSLAAYTAIFGWKYAAGVIALLMVHEMGHFIAAKQRGLAVSTPTFIPFVGAWIQLKEQPMDVETEAYVASAGPLIGTLGALAIYYWGRTT